MATGNSCYVSNSINAGCLVHSHFKLACVIDSILGICFVYSYTYPLSAGQHAGKSFRQVFLLFSTSLALQIPSREQQAARLLPELQTKFLLTVRLPSLHWVHRIGCRQGKRRIQSPPDMVARKAMHDPRARYGCSRLDVGRNLL